MEELMDNYKKYKWFFTSAGNLVLGGKNATQNEELLHLIKKDKKEHIIMHTSTPGSPFSVILGEIRKIKKQEMGEAAIFTACFSQQWKSGKMRADVDIFNSSQLFKPERAKVGTWQVLGKVETVSVPLELFLIKQKGILRAVPETAAKGKEIARITPGKINKNLLIPKMELEMEIRLSQNEILSALPAGGIKLDRVGVK